MPTSSPPSNPIATSDHIASRLDNSGVSFRGDREQDASIEKFLQLVDAHERFLVVSHTHPDGDAVGSTLAMGLLLEKLGKRVTYYNRDEMPPQFRFLPAADRWVTTLAPDHEPIDVTVILDCAQLHRIGESLEEAGILGDQIAVVDHHKTWDDDFASVYVRDVDAAATGEVIFRILTAAGLELDADIARCLYCCVLTDTGSFRYSSTSKRSFQIAGELLEAGIDPWEMTSAIYESQPLEKVKLLGMALSTLERRGALASIRLEQKMFEALLGDQRHQMDLTGLADGFINHARGIAGVEMAAQLYEEQISDPTALPTWRVAFRSRGHVDAARLAAMFGGGGNRNAAGCTIVGEAADVEQQLAMALSTLMSAPTSSP